MESRWSDREAQRFLDLYGEDWGEDLALRTYSARLIGSEPSLVLHGGGNTSVKGICKNLFGEQVEALFVKASGYDLGSITPDGHCALEIEPLKKMRTLPALSDDLMVSTLRRHLLKADSPNPSIEALVHAFLPCRFIDHCHADSILALTNQPDPQKLLEEALEEDVIILDYLEPGFELAKAMIQAFEERPDPKGAVWIRHGLITWGESARESYERTIQFVEKAESFLKTKARSPFVALEETPLELAHSRWRRAAPLIRGCLASDSGIPDRPYKRVILVPLINRDVLEFVNSKQGKALALTPPLTTDHLIRTKPLPAWVDLPNFDDPDVLKTQIVSTIESFRREYEEYLNRHRTLMASSLSSFDSSPRVVLLPGIGVACAGRNLKEAEICRDITAQTLQVKRIVSTCGEYEGLGERELFVMEYRSLQHAKLNRLEPALGREVAIVTGAAGAIGSGICRKLLEEGCNVAVTDLHGKALDSLVQELGKEHGNRVLGVPIDVTDAASVKEGFETVISHWGGVDFVIVNAGIALVSSLKDMSLEAFRKLEKVNVEGTLLVLAEAARHFELQGTGGDIVLISTKNVFAPGATFGAYSSTKAASHQLARIASLEMASIGVRVNMVAPDAVFADGDRKSGLWEEVGPDRMRARGLDEKSLQEYYRSRNLLKSRVTAQHVANAVMFFLTRQTPTTGATIPVDGGLPDSTPR
jgi:rhamnose utilization protein RhaD (predicted bifunctional aldolase and dehydrogenase)/NAD(P)-dependent dehydrogenase (short-subunit alcohol dehydrogenase family)